MSSNFAEWVFRFKIPNLPLIHAGAHFAEERFVYRDSNFEPVFWIEAVPAIAEECQKNLKDFPNQSLITAPISAFDDEEVTFFLAGAEDSSSSLLEPYLISASHPEVKTHEEIKLKTRTLDSLFADSYFGSYAHYGLVLDLQGAEAQALLGGKRLLSKIDFIISEVSIRQLYKGGIPYSEFSEILKTFGFELVASDINRTTGWGEALFINSKGGSSQILNGIKPENKITGRFSFGTYLRTILMQLHVPSSTINRIKRR